MSDKQYTATLNNHALQVPSLKMYRVRTAQATADCKAAASISTGDTITITDGNGTTVVGEYRKTGNGSSDFDIDISGATTAAEVATATVAAIAQQTASCFHVRVEASSATITFKFYESGLPASNATPANSSGTPLENITTFEDDTDPLPVEEVTASITKPASAPSVAASSGGSLSGDFYYGWTYYDAVSDTESDIVVNQTQVSPDGTTNGTVTVTFGTVSTSPTGRATHIKVYRTTDGSETDFRLVAHVPVGAATYADTTLDANLSVTTARADNQTVPDMDYVINFAARLWGIKGNQLYCSKPENPDAWPPAGYGRFTIGGFNSGDNVAIAPMGDSLIVYKRNSIQVVDYNIDPASSIRIDEAYSGRGALNPRCVVVSDARHFVLDSNGLYMYEDLTRIVDLGGPIRKFLGRLNLSQSAKFSGIATNDTLRFFVALDDDTECNWCLNLDLNVLRATGRVHWWPEYYDNAIADVTPYTFGSSAGVDQLAYKTVPVVMDTRANVFMLDWLTTDGAPSNLMYSSTVSSVDNSGSGGVGRITKTTETRGFTSSWNSSTYNALGLTLRLIKPDGLVSEPFQITAVDSNNRVELDRAFTSAELTDFASATFYLGSIHTLYDSKEFSWGSPHLAKTLDYAYLSYDPSPFDFDLNFYVNRDRRGADYMQITGDDGVWSSTTDVEGLTVSMGGNTSDDGGYGFARLPVGDESFRYMQWRLEGWLPGRPFRLNETFSRLHDEENYTDQSVGMGDI